MKAKLKKTIRLFCNEKLSLKKIIILDQKDSHYLKNVMRCKENDNIILFNEKDGEYLTEIVDIRKNEMTLKVIQKRSNKETINDNYLVFSLVKKNKIDFIIQKATELGIRKIFPILTDRSSLRDINIKRLENIAKEASEQSNRISIPEINKLLTLEALIKGWNKKRSILYADESLKKNKNITMLYQKNFVKSSLLIGPEGGFSVKENEMLKMNKFIFPISFGHTVLRSETATIVGLSYLNLICSSYKIIY
tara:strand:- start:359 stop:1108 length:750 start_codon:yes stop_codon:yes gene_type:complete